MLECQHRFELILLVSLALSCSRSSCSYFPLSLVYLMSVFVPGRSRAVQTYVFTRRSKQVSWADRVESKASNINGPRPCRTSDQRINSAINRAEKAVDLKPSVTQVELKVSADINGRLLYRTSNQGINSAIKRAEKAAESAISNEIERKDQATRLDFFLFRTREECSRIK
jgi:hypothetical protein